MPSQKGKALSWVIFAVLIVAAFALLWFFQRKSPSVPTGETPGAIQGESETKKPSKGFAKEELSETEKASLDNDALNKALRGAGNCEDIVHDDALKQVCIDSMLFDKAIASHDEKLCEQLQDEARRAECLDSVTLYLAYQGSNASLCEKISNATMSQECKDRFLAQKGSTATSAKDCDPIQNANLKQDCLDNFNFSASVQALTVESCDSISDSELKSRCAKIVVKNLEVIELGKSQMLGERLTTEEKLQGCAALAGAEADSCNDQANFSLAGEKNDLAYCNLIKDPNLQKNCVATQTDSINQYYLRLAVTSKDSSLCSKILDEGLKAACATYAK